MKIDVIGDIHGCIEELHDLFHALGYQWEDNIPFHPDGRIPAFVGDLTDRGPNSIAVINLVYEMVVEHKRAIYVPGNHCNKLYRYFLGNNVKQQHGLETTVAEWKALDAKQQKVIQHHFMTLYEQADLYVVLPEVNAVVAHAGISADLIGKTNKKVKTFVLYGDITGETHPDGRPVRRDWAQSYQGEQWIVYGHTPVKKPRILNKTINIDTGCVFGNALTAFRLPEEETVSVPSKQQLVEEKFQTFD
ncbi:bis(5'-nucleosyl)-tetraphosphatase PrpE [Aquibacillus koreensis]|uniref:Bis(5'-nucleosyl)-tetraphosphatase PrpE n=1 Tax=Aquibacillus koreensis TaxID=279446 RepID=A0A9X3WMN2_9BACI|nr:bis(5'-nucleosyl)-tetraphosphatase PrpE [Aquibacillus koreensis]MCT2535666.1 bis(5'-nucleosyl)-tetraphosphatase PrpE [Aquibacillus koreensis]MDC3420049.1 bis(5'-nucleosyl)-tetraphosphatase PrpE [Aquibacillus koreensis]